MAFVLHVYLSVQEGLPMSTDQNEEILLYELGLEEAFFLCHELNCLQVCHKSKEVIFLPYYGLFKNICKYYLFALYL